MTVLIILLMLICNALLAAYEMAIASISRTRLAIFVQQKQAGAESALYLKDHLEGSLAIVQIGITLAGALAAAYGGSGAESWFSPWLIKHAHLSAAVAHTISMMMVVLPLSFITIVFAELTPKTFAIKNKDFVVLRFSPYIRLLYTLLAPIVKLMENIVRITARKISKVSPLQDEKQAAMTDLRAAAAIASSSRLFGKTEEKIVLSTAQFCIRCIREIQVPLDQVYMLDADDSIADTFIKAHLDMHTRFPVRQDPQDPQSIVGYLNFKDMFQATKVSAGQPTTARTIMRPIMRLQADTIISAALEKMMKNKQHICLVTEEEKITGILTLEDIFEEMVGEIEDEYDFSPAYIRPFGASLVASASAKMADVFERLGVALPADVSSQLTVEQWVHLHLNHAPTKNEKIRADGILLETRKFRRHKLVEVLLSNAE